VADQRHTQLSRLNFKLAKNSKNATEIFPEPCEAGQLTALL